MCSKQETFNIVVDHLRQQNERATVVGEGTNSCAYRGDNNTMCAVGCLIPDEEYNPELEGKTIFSSEVQDLVKQLGHDLLLVGDLQYVHDAKDIKVWEAGFQAIANLHDLIYSAPS